MSICRYRKIVDKKLLHDLKETYMYDVIDVHISPTNDYPVDQHCAVGSFSGGNKIVVEADNVAGVSVVYKTQDNDISRQIEIIKNFLNGSDIQYLKDTIYVNVVMSGYSEGDMCDTYIFLVKLEANVANVARKMRIRAQSARF